MSANQTKVFITDPVKAALSGVTAAFCIAVVIVAVTMEEFIGAGIFAAVAMVFGYIFFKTCRLMRIDKEGIEVSFFGIGRRSLKWKEVGELGCCGMKVFKDPKSKRSGALYIYFSEKPMSDSERFDMVLKWPRPNIPYLSYSRKRLDFIQYKWDDEIVFYNADRARLNFSWMRKM